SAAPQSHPFRAAQRHPRGDVLRGEGAAAEDDRPAVPADIGARTRKDCRGRVGGEEGEGALRLIVEPEDGIEPVLHGIATARKTLDISIFRLDYEDITKALHGAVSRGVVVRALVANRNGTDAKALRRLEMQLLETGATVCRTDNDLVRYH